MHNVFKEKRLREGGAAQRCVSFSDEDENLTPYYHEKKYF